MSMSAAKLRAIAQRRERSAAAVGILEPDDVVLAEIAAGLHLDQRQRDAAGIFQPVDAAERQIDALVLLNQPPFGIARDQGAAVHDHPVLGAVIVFLQRQPVAGIDDDPLYLEAVALD